MGSLPPVLLNVVAAGLFLALLGFLSVRRPPPQLWRPLVAFQIFVLLYILGDAITLVSRDMFWEQLGIAILYSGALPAAAVCWTLAVRYAEETGCRFRFLGPWALRLPIAATVLAWAVMITNPWHGRFLVPVIGADNQHLELWQPVVSLGYLLTWAAVGLLALVAFRAPEADARRRAAIMMGGLLLTLFFNYLSYERASRVPLDLTLVGLCIVSGVFLYGTYRTVRRDRDELENRVAERTAELHASEERLREAQRLESLGVLAGGIAHDFNQVLSVVLGNSALVAEQLEEDSTLRQRVERIRSAARHGAELTEQILTYAGRSEPKITGLDLAAVVSEMEDLLRASVFRRATLETRAEEPVWVRGDATQIRQVVMNLVSNASEAVRDSGGTIRVLAGRMRATRADLRAVVTSTLLEEGEYAFVEVADDGMGMDEETRSRIFEPFYSTKFTGRGLGLAVVHGVVRGHAGGIQVTSARGRGTSVRVLLPPLKDSDESRRPPASGKA